MRPIGVVTKYLALYGTPNFIHLIPTPPQPTPMHTSTPHLLLKMFREIYLLFVKNEAGDVFGTLPFGWVGVYFIMLFVIKYVRSTF